MQAVLAAMLAVALAAPFARREDVIGLLAFLVLFAAAAVIWGLLVRGLWRDRPQSGSS